MSIIRAFSEDEILGNMVFVEGEAIGQVMEAKIGSTNDVEYLKMVSKACDCHDNEIKIYHNISLDEKMRWLYKRFFVAIGKTDLLRQEIETARLPSLVKDVSFKFIAEKSKTAARDGKFYMQVKSYIEPLTEKDVIDNKMAVAQNVSFQAPTPPPFDDLPFN